VTPSLAERLRRELDARAASGLLRTLRPSDGIDFSSNDYLGLSRHPVVLDAVADAARRGSAHGSTGSRLLSGNRDEHVEVESRFAMFMGRERALLFGSGFAANMALLSALPGRRDLVVLDESAHASLKEGARASLAARRSFRHNDPVALERTLRDRDAFGDVFIVVEGIYSMDGDRTPLEEIIEIAERYSASVVVDEAHATGLYGRGLRGIHETIQNGPPLATVHPCGKALGSYGAFVAADAVVIEYLVNTARPFLFSTAPPPLQAVALDAALDLLPSVGDRVEAVLGLSARLRERLGELSRWRTIESDSPIVPVVIGTDDDAVRAARLVRERGFDVRPIRPPTVRPGTSRLRISVTSERTVDEVDRLASAVIEAEKIISPEES